MPIIFAGLVGAILWNVITWYLGIPSSSSHALVGGVVGSVIAGAGSSAVIWSGIASKVVIPAVLAPFVRLSQVASSSMVGARARNE